LAAALTTLGVAGFFLARSPLFNQSGPWAGDWGNLGNGILLGFWGVIVTLFGLGLLFEEGRHLMWGGLVVIGNALTGLFILGTYSYQLRASSYLPSIFTLSDGLTLILMMTSPSVGVVGGLLGVFWKRSWKQGAAIPGLAGASRLALVGGVLMFFMILPTTSFFPGPWLLLSAFLVIVFSMLVYRGRGNPRLLGVSIIAASLLAGYSFYGGDVLILGNLDVFPNFQKSPFYLYTRLDPVWTTWAFIGIAGLILAMIGGLRTILWKEEKHVNLEIPRASV
jgi:hypothetical protein